MPPEKPLTGLRMIKSENVGVKCSAQHPTPCRDSTNDNHYRGASQVAPVAENSPANAGDVRVVGLISGSGRTPGGGYGYPLQYSCVQNPMDWGAWWATVHRVAKSWTRLKGLHTHVAATRGECLKNTVLEKNTPWEGGHISANTARKSWEKPKLITTSSPWTFCSP